MNLNRPSSSISISTILSSLQSELSSLKTSFQEQRQYRKSQSIHIFQQLQSHQLQLNKPTPTTRASITSSRTSLGSHPNIKSSDNDVLVDQDEILQTELLRCLSESRLGKQKGMLIRQQGKLERNLKQDFGLLMKEFSEFKGQIKLEMAGLRDGFQDLDFNVEQCLRTIGSPKNMKALIDGVVAVEQKTNGLVNLSQKISTQIELLKEQIDVLNGKLVGLSEQLPEQVFRLQQKSNNIKEEFETSQIQLGDYLSRKLNKMIESYNCNFEEVDRSVNQIKEVLIDVVKISKVIKEKIGLRLSQTVDAQTFQRTIDVLNESFHATYLVGRRMREMEETEMGMDDEGIFHNEQEITNLPIQQTSTIITQNNLCRFNKKAISQRTDDIQQAFKRRGKDGQRNRSDSDRSKPITSLADELRNLEEQ